MSKSMFRRGVLKKLVIRGMYNHPTKSEFTTEELSLELGLPRAQVANCMRRMVRQGEAVVEGMKHSQYKKYSLTPRGEVLAMPIPTKEDPEVVEPMVTREAGPYELYEDEEESFPSADEIVESFLRKIMDYEDRAIEDGDIIKDQVDEIAKLQTQVDELQLKLNERRSIVGRLAARVR